MAITDRRAMELERLLRRLRQCCFENDKAARLIPVVKARLMPIWDARRAEVTHRRGLRLLQTYT